MRSSPRSTGLGGADQVQTAGPPPQDDCCCITLEPDEGSYIQDAIDALPEAGGCICLLPGEHRPDRTILIRRSNVTLKAESGGAVVHLRGEAPVLIIGDQSKPVSDVLVSRLNFMRRVGRTPPAIIIALSASRSRIEHCAIANLEGGTSPGIVLSECREFTIVDCLLFNVAWGIVASGRSSDYLSFRRNRIALENTERDERGVGIWFADVKDGCVAEENVIVGPGSGIRVTNTAVQGVPTLAPAGQTSSPQFVRVINNVVACIFGFGHDPQRVLESS